MHVTFGILMPINSLKIFSFSHLNNGIYLFFMQFAMPCRARTFSDFLIEICHDPFSLIFKWPVENSKWVLDFIKLIKMYHQPQQPQNCDEEQRFLFGSKKIRSYGSIDDLNSPSISAPKIARIIVHKIQQTDTLQSLELRYNSSMFEIKRLNKLWSNQSLFCKSEVLIPIFEDACSSESGCSSAPSADFTSPTATQLDRLEKEAKRENDESLDQLLKRIDMSMKRTKKAVKRLHQRAASRTEEGQ